MNGYFGHLSAQYLAIVVLTASLPTWPLAAGKESATAHSVSAPAECATADTKGLPVAVSVEIRAGGTSGRTCVYAANEIIIRKDFEVAHGLGIALENKLSGDIAASPALSDELTLGAGLRVLPFVTFGLAGKVFLEGGRASAAVDGIVGLEYEWENAGVCLGDYNEFLVHLPGVGFEYVNTLEFRKEFSLGRERGLFIALENECAVADDAVANTLRAGPGYHWRFLSVYGNYVTGWEDDTPGHGAEAGVCFEF